MYHGIQPFAICSDDMQSSALWLWNCVLLLEHCIAHINDVGTSVEVTLVQYILRQVVGWSVDITLCLFTWVDYIMNIYLLCSMCWKHLHFWWWWDYSCLFYLICDKWKGCEAAWMSVMVKMFPGITEFLSCGNTLEERQTSAERMFLTSWTACHEVWTLAWWYGVSEELCCTQRCAFWATQ